MRDRQPPVALPTAQLSKCAQGALPIVLATHPNQQRDTATSVRIACKQVVLWMDRILHHLGPMGNHSLLVFTGESNPEPGSLWCEKRTSQPSTASSTPRKYDMFKPAAPGDSPHKMRWVAMSHVHMGHWAPSAKKLRA